MSDTTVAPDVLKKTPGRGRHLRVVRAKTLAVNLGIIALTTAITSLAIKLVWRGFTYWGDNAESFLPLWHMWGTAIRSGEPFLFDHNAWASANRVGEAAYELLNPFTAAIAVFISFFDNLNIAGFLVVTMAMVLFGWGVFGVARSYGARRVAALVVGAAAPFAGFTLFYEAGNWLTGLLSITATLHFWWAAREFARGRIGPIWPFVFGALGALLGSPYAAVGMFVVLVALGLELLVRRDFRRFMGLVLVGAAVAGMLILAFIALAYALPVTERDTHGTFAGNANYLAPSLSDFVALSAPTYLPRTDAWWQGNEIVPSTYLAWFIAPLLPWFRFAVLRDWRRLLSLYVFGASFLILALGPDRLWLFRWPIRFSEYFGAACFVLFAVLLSHGLDRRRPGIKWILTVSTIVAGCYMSWSATPWIPWHYAVGLVVVGLMVLMLAAEKRWGLRALAAVSVVGTLVFAVIQAQLFGWSHQHVTDAADQPPPPALSTVRDASRSFEGRVLQIADLGSLNETDAVVSGELAFGNFAAAAGVDTMNRYTGISFPAFTNALAIDYRGSVNPAIPLQYYFGDLSEEIPIPILDALGVNTLVIAKNRSGIDDLDQLAVGWHTVDDTANRVVLVRDTPLQYPVLHALGDVDIRDAAEDGEYLSFQVRSASGGRVLIDRLAWPGYAATLDGHPLEIQQEPFGVMSVVIPEGSDGLVEIRYEYPGLFTGAVAAAIAIVAAIGYQAIWVARRRHAHSGRGPERTVTQRSP